LNQIKEQDLERAPDCSFNE